jgi:transketolase
MPRKNVTAVYVEGSSFEIGKGNLLREGKDLTIIASGIMVAEALKAAERLKEYRIYARVVDMFPIKPIDTELVDKCARETKALVTAENHNIYGGLGSAVSEAAAKTTPVPIEMVGVTDRFGQVGTEDYLKKEYGLTADAIVEAAKRAVSRKKRGLFNF